MSFTPLKSPFLTPEIELPEFVLPAVLPDDIGALKSLLQAQQDAMGTVRQQAMREAHNYIIRMIEQSVLARHRMFGVSSEQLSAQGRLFDEAETLAQSTTGAQDVAELPAAAADTKSDETPKARGKRGPLSAALKRVDVVHNVPENERTCPCGTPMVEIGEDVSEQLDIVPMQVPVLRHIRKRYGCPTSAHAPVTAPLPPQPLPKSNASADFLAMLLTTKYVDGLPLARFENVLERHGAPVPRQTLARWVIAASRILQPLHNLMRAALLDGAVIPVRQHGHATHTVAWCFPYSPSPAVARTVEHTFVTARWRPPRAILRGMPAVMAMPPAPSSTWHADDGLPSQAASP